jgi:hypothetical protein
MLLNASGFESAVAAVSVLYLALTVSKVTSVCVLHVRYSKHFQHLVKQKRKGCVLLIGQNCWSDMCNCKRLIVANVSNFKVKSLLAFTASACIWNVAI